MGFNSGFKGLNRRKDKMYKECWNKRQQVSVRSTG